MMEAKGTNMHSDYSDNFKGTKYLLNEREEDIMDCIDQMLELRNKDDVITLADIGTSDGGNVLQFMVKLIEHIKTKKSVSQQINVVFEDHSSNDFNALVRNIVGYNDGKGLQSLGNIHVFVNPISMYNQILPDGTLDFGISSYCVHWLSDWKIKMKNSIFSDNADKEELDIIEKQAKEDWRTFVYKRGRELKRGGFFFVSTVMAENKNYFDCLQNVYKEMVADGIISQKELENTNAAWFLNRTEEDIRFPFTNDADLEMKNLNLRLVSVRVTKREYFPLSSVNSDATFAKRAKDISSAVRGWAYNVLFRGLSQERTVVEKSAIVDEYFERLRLKFTSEYKNVTYVNPMADVLFTKQ